MMVIYYDGKKQEEHYCMATRQGTRWRRSPLLAEKVFLLLLSVWRVWWALEEGDLVVMMTAMMVLMAMVMMTAMMMLTAKVMMVSVVMMVMATVMMVSVVMAELTMQQGLGARGAAHALEKVRTAEDLVAGHLALP